MHSLISANIHDSVVLDFLEKAIGKENSPIFSLSLTVNRLTHQCINDLIIVLNRPKLSHLKSLDLSCNPIGCQGIKALTPYLKDNKHLTTLDLSNCKILAEGAKALIEALNDSVLQNLDLSSNKLTDEIFVPLQHNNNLSHLNISSCELDEKSFSSLIRALAGNSSLDFLDLSHNFIHDATFLINALKINSHLRFLALRSVEADNAFAKKIIEFWPTKRSLQSVHLTSNAIGEEILDLLIAKNIHYEHLYSPSKVDWGINVSNPLLWRRVQKSPYSDLKEAFTCIESRLSPTAKYVGIYDEISTITKKFFSSFETDITYLLEEVFMAHIKIDHGDLKNLLKCKKVKVLTILDCGLSSHVF